MKKCEKCGVELDDNAMFCTSCGEKFGEAAKEAAKESPFAPNAGAKGGVNKFAIIGIAAGALLLVIVLVALIVSLLTGYKKPIKAYYAAVNEQEKAAKSVLLPAEYKLNLHEYSFTIEDKEKIGKGDLGDLVEIFEDEYDETYKFSSGYVVEVDYEAVCKEKPSKNYDGTLYFIVVKKGMKWYVFDTMSGDYDLDEVIDKYLDYNLKD